uniref:Endonuclease-reverse transcriptase n=1 Tax=Bombyx mori TaxID=7091 RepID=A0A8R2LYT8_BOMMO|nr:uncharacterized protein LOC119629162 [Bombyx mori]
MAELLYKLETVSMEMGLAINKSKTKLMIIDRFKAIQRNNVLHDYETVTQFPYLGSLITNKGSSEPEIRRRTGMAKSAMTQLSNILRDRNITHRTKIHLVRTLVFSIALYSAETWTLKAADRQRIDAFEMWCWRLCGVSDKEHFRQSILTVCGRRNSADSLQNQNLYTQESAL